MSTELQRKSPSRTLSKRYTLALSLVALLSIAGQVAIQFSIKRQSSDAITINIAGRQRMLSQRLTKTALAIQISRDRPITHQYVEELQDVVNLWETSHRGLQVGDVSLGLPGRNSAAVEELFADIQEAHQTMLAAANGILNLAKTQPNSAAQSPNFSRFIGQILAQEGHFLQGMDAIVGQYQQEAEARVARISQIQWFLLGITLLVLLLEAWLIFYPTVSQIHEYITELQKAKAKADQLSAQLEQQNIELETSLDEAYSATRLKSELIANVSHELLTPMNAVIGMTSVLAQTELNSQQQDFVETIRQSSKNLLQLIHDILDFSKIEAGQLQLEIQPLDLRQCLEESLEVVAPDVANKELNIAYEIDRQTPPQIFGDSFRLRQILLNLLSNAVKFTHQGEVIVSVSAENLGEWSINQDDSNNESVPVSEYQEIEFSVRDTGIGIPEEKIHQLFRSFSPMDGSNVREYAGLGLGLSISKRLTELMGGRLWVESQPGIGSTFSFNIVAKIVPNTSDRLSQVQPGLQGKRLLIVSHHRTSRKILRRQTEQWGMLCVDVENGAAALESIQQGNQFDLALLDQQMPQMDGLSLGRLIHQEKRLPDLKLVIVSPIACPVKLPDSDFLGCLSKPIKVSQLYQMMMDLLAGSPNSVKGETSEPQSETLEGKKKETNTEPLADRLPLRILLAEDNAVNQKVALRILNRLGYTADVAKNGLEAIAALEEKPYDLVLMDIQMPKMDGLEATRRICQQWQDPISTEYATQVKPWIVAITAGGTDGDRRQCLAAGMDGYLNKPIDLELLQATLESLGERSKFQDIPNNLPVNATHNGSKPSIAVDEIVTIDLTVLEKLRQELSAPEESNIVGEIIDVFLEDTPSLLGAIEEAIEAQDPSSIIYAVHTLKGSTSNLGIRKMYHLCFQLQELSLEGYFEESSQLLAELKAEFLRVQAAFESQPERFY